MLEIMKQYISEGNLLEQIVHFLMSPKLWISLIIVAILFAVWRGLKKFVNLQVEKREVTGTRKNNIHMIMMSLKIIMIVLILVVVLQINGVNVMSLVTGFGIVGIVIGFALQDMLKDLMMGINIIWDNYFKIGDMVHYGTVDGRISYFNIKVTKIYDVNTGNTITIANRNISEITLLSDWLDVEVPAPYEIEAVRMRQICQQICDRIEQVETVASCEFLGTDDFADSKIIYRIRIHCPADKKSPLRRCANGIIQDIFYEEEIAMPYPHMDVKLVHWHDHN